MVYISFHLYTVWYSFFCKYSTFHMLFNMSKKFGMFGLMYYGKIIQTIVHNVYCIHFLRSNKEKWQLLQIWEIHHARLNCHLWFLLMDWSVICNMEKKGLRRLSPLFDNSLEIHQNSLFTIMQTS
jgi:hypothetical protein